MNDAIFNLLVDERNYKLNKKEKEIAFYKQKYDDSIKKLQEKENELDIYRIQLQDTQNQLQEEKNSKDGLKRNLTLYKNKSLNQTTRINSLQTEIDNMRVKNKHNNDKIINLLEEIKIKDDELKKLNRIIKNNDKLNEPITISFTSSYINENIVCCNNDIFSDITEKLFQKYPLLNNDNIHFLYNGKIIEKNQSVLLNEIKNNAVILIA